jgi:hypothetical protein
VDERILAHRAHPSPTDQEHQGTEEPNCFYCLEGRVFLGSLQRLAAVLNRRTLRLLESLLPNRQVGAVGRGMKRARSSTYSGLASPTSNVTLVWSPPSSTEGENDCRVEMTVVVLLHRTNLPPSVKTRPWCLRI